MLLESKTLRVFLNCLLFTIMIAICYLFVDVPLTLYAQSLRHFLYIPLRIISIIISPPTQLLIWSCVLIYYLFIKKSVKYTLMFYPLAASLILSNTLVRVIKVIVGRSRPHVFLSNGIYHLNMISFDRIFSSLPSGHATTIGCVMGFLAAKYPKKAFLLIVLCVILSLSRVFIAAHYLSDVLVGNFIGLYTAWLFYYTESLRSPAFLVYTEKGSLWRKAFKS